MQNTAYTLIAGAAVGLNIRLEPDPSIVPTLWVQHVKNQSYCDALNDAAWPATGIKNLFQFNQEACACFYDQALILGVEDLDAVSVAIKTIPHLDTFADGAIQSPLDPAQSFLPCQLDQIYAHGLDRNCEAFVGDLPYDYRTALSEHFGVHNHGPPDPEAVGYDEHGRFGDFDENCQGNVIHWVSSKSMMVLDSPKQEEEPEEDVEEMIEEQETQESTATEN